MSSPLDIVSIEKEARKRCDYNQFKKNASACLIPVKEAYVQTENKRKHSEGDDDHHDENVPRDKAQKTSSVITGLQSELGQIISTDEKNKNSALREIMGVESPVARTLALRSADQSESSQSVMSDRIRAIKSVLEDDIIKEREEERDPLKKTGTELIYSIFMRYQKEINV